ncbi:MAG: HAMP domain-containing histidine kinase [Anaerolineae bacterium]|nr:HAMP domain-containing histidine kinase [Anaerolineae bacterium]
MTTIPATEVSILFATGEAAWAASVQATLEAAGYRLSVRATFDETAALPPPAGHDVIIAAVNSRSLLAFEALHSQPAPQRPLLILITADVDALTAPPPIAADLLLPPVPAYVERQLQTFLHLHQANASLARQKQAADDQVVALRQELEAGQRARNEIEILKNAIVRNISHELKTPLLHVKSAVSLIAGDVADKRIITYAENATARLEVLVKNITMLGSSLDINIGPLILRDSIDYARRNLARVWQTRTESDRIQIAIDDGLPPVYADKQGLATVLQLLMDNALKFSEKAISVRAYRREQRVYISVRDDGIGIAPEKLNDIFEMFYQVDPSSTRRYGGAGVGLTLVKLILEHHGSSITCESTPGRGSVFTFWLNVADMDGKSAAE